MVGVMWRRELSPINHHFAIFEVLAHLEYLERQGKVHHRSRNGALQWHVVILSLLLAALLAAGQIPKAEIDRRLRRL